MYFCESFQSFLVVSLKFAVEGYPVGYHGICELIYLCQVMRKVLRFLFIIVLSVWAVDLSAQSQAVQFFAHRASRFEYDENTLGSLTHNFSHIITREASSLFFLSNLFSIFVVYISKYRRYETCN